MNCKPGDLARIVGGRLDGFVIRVTTLDPGSPCGMPLWFYEGCVKTPYGERYDALFDAVLRPIRDQPGADETLAWKEVPLPNILAPKPQREFVR